MNGKRAKQIRRHAFELYTRAARQATEAGKQLTVTPRQVYQSLKRAYKQNVRTPNRPRNKPA